MPDGPRKLRKRWIGIGLAIGAGLGVALRAIPIGVGLGLVFGVVMSKHKMG